MATTLPAISPRGARPQAAGGLPPHVVWASIKDRIYQHSVNLRKTYRELDADGKGAIPIPVFIEEMGRVYQLSPHEKECILPMLQEADFRRDGRIDFREFCEMLKMHDHKNSPRISDNEKQRFQQKGAMDRRMQEALRTNADRDINIETGLPTNELGSMTIDAPYGVLGDSEKMDAVIATFLNIKIDQLRETFQRHDSNKDGLVTHIEFRAAMKEMDRYIFDDEVKVLLDVLDPKRKGSIAIEEFVRGAGREYLKKKAHRSNTSYNSPFEWDAPEPSPRVISPRNQAATLDKAEKRVLKKPGMTRGEELRLSTNRAKMTDIFRKEDDNRRRRIAAGTSLPTEKAAGSPRYPQSNSARIPKPPM